MADEEEKNRTPRLTIYERPLPAVKAKSVCWMAEQKFWSKTKWQMNKQNNSTICMWRLFASNWSDLFADRWSDGFETVGATGGCRASSQDGQPLYRQAKTRQEKGKLILRMKRKKNFDQVDCWNELGKISIKKKSENHDTIQRERVDIRR